MAQSGEYVVPGALSPVTVNVDQDEILRHTESCQHLSRDTLETG